MALHKLVLTFLLGLIFGGVSGQFEQLAFFQDDIPVPENTTLVEHRNFLDLYLNNTVNTTILMTYHTWNDYGYYIHGNTYNMAYDGFVYGFQFYASFQADIQISIWRWEELFSPYYYSTDETWINGSYTLVGITDVLTTIDGPHWHFVYLEESWRVTPNDFLGITFGKENPLAFDINPDCENSFQNILQTCSVFHCYAEDPKWEWDTEYHYQQHFDFYPNTSNQFPWIDNSCKDYSLQALLMPDTQHTNCKMIQLTTDYRKYDLLSHEDYGSRNYYDYTDSCWVIRAAYSESVIHMDLMAFDLEYSDGCTYDALYVETEDGDIEHRCGSSEFTPNVYSSPSPVIILRFTTDFSVTAGGFHFELRSVEMTLYNDYINGDLTAWPWEARSSSQSPPSSTPPSPTGDANTSGSDFKLARQIGIIIGSSILGLFLLNGLIACCYMCCCKKKPTKKVHPEKVKSNKAPMNMSAPYPQQRYANQPLPQQQAGVYSLSQPQGPSKNALPPLSTGMPAYHKQNPAMNGHGGSNYPKQPPPPPPYPKQKYAQPPAQANTETPLQPTGLQQPQPSQPAPSQLKQSLSTIAFAMRQPKPLKSKGEPFGGASKPQPKTEAEMLTLARARLNWRVAVIPGPAVYIEPQQWKQGNQGMQAVGPPSQPFDHRFAEEDVSYAID